MRCLIATGCYESQELFASVAISDLLKALEDQETVELYNKTAGLCRVHLEQALEESTLETKKLLLQIARNKTADISADFEEYFRKLDYRYSKEPKGKEQMTWLRAMQFYDSYITMNEPRPKKD